MHEIVLINYENKLKEMEKLLNSWSRRNITPLGKITVIKTLVISKVTRLFMNLPDPDVKCLHDLNLLLYSFLWWTGKHDRIKRSGVCQAYEAGGLKMVDVRSFLSALKIGWLKLSCVIMGKLQRFYRLCVHWFKTLENVVVNLPM